MPNKIGTGSNWTIIADLKRRRRLWRALSDLFLDTELCAVDHREIAEQIIAAGISASEAKAIMVNEVLPVCWANLVSPAGEWQHLREEEICPQIEARLQRLSGFPPIAALRQLWWQAVDRLVGPDFAPVTRALYDIPRSAIR